MFESMSICYEYFSEIKYEIKITWNYLHKENSRRIRIPNTNNMAISTDYFWFRRIECLVPLDVQYSATVPKKSP